MCSVPARSANILRGLTDARLKCNAFVYITKVIKLQRDAAFSGCAICASELSQRSWSILSGTLTTGAYQSRGHASFPDRAHPSGRGYERHHNDDWRHHPADRRDSRYDGRGSRRDDRYDSRNDRQHGRDSARHEGRADRRDVKREVEDDIRREDRRNSRPHVKQEVTANHHDSHDRQHEDNVNRHVSNDARPAEGSHDAAAAVAGRRQLVDGASAQSAGLQYGLTANMHQDSDRR